LIIVAHQSWDRIVVEKEIEKYMGDGERDILVERSILGRTA
jgi:hypothetical protein